MGSRRGVRRVTLAIAVVLAMAMVGPSWTAAGSGPSVEATNAPLTTALPPITTILPTVGTPTATPAPTSTQTTSTPAQTTTSTTTSGVLGTTVPDPTNMATTVESVVNDSTGADGTQTTDLVATPSLAVSLVNLDAPDVTDGIGDDLAVGETTQAPRPGTPAPTTTDPPTEPEREPADDPGSGSAGTATAAASAGSAGGLGGPPALPDPEDAAPVAAVGLGAIAAAALVRQVGLAATPSWPGLEATFRAGIERVVNFTSAFRYSRHDDSDPLEHEVRATVHEAIDASPGLHLSAVAEATDVPLSTVRHHVRVLEREDLLSAVKLRGKRRFFPVDADDHELAAALTDEATAAVLAAVARNEPASVTTLAAALDRDASTVSHHLSRLTEDGLVERERDGRRVLSRLSPRARAAFGEGDQTAPDRAIQSAD